jgi:PTS system nitrogen regulatory IIA component
LSFPNRWRRRASRGLRLAGKAGLFEVLGALPGRAEPALSRETILAALREREHPGGTGIGLGVAIPHGRVPGLGRCGGAFAALAQATDHHAIDGKPVTMVLPCWCRNRRCGNIR